MMHGCYFSDSRSFFHQKQLFLQQNQIQLADEGNEAIPEKIASMI